MAFIQNSPAHSLSALPISYTNTSSGTSSPQDRVNGHIADYYMDQEWKSQSLSMPLAADPKQTMLFKQLPSESHGWTTTLHLAAERGHEKVVRLLLDQGANIDAWNKYGWTALHFAAENGHEAVARILLRRGANIHLKSTSGRTALHHAAEKGWEEIVRMLFLEGADVNEKAHVID